MRSCSSRVPTSGAVGGSGRHGPPADSERESGWSPSSGRAPPGYAGWSPTPGWSPFHPSHKRLVRVSAQSIPTNSTGFHLPVCSVRGPCVAQPQPSMGRRWQRVALSVVPGHANSWGEIVSRRRSSRKEGLIFSPRAAPITNTHSTQLSHRRRIGPINRFRPTKFVRKNLAPLFDCQVGYLAYPIMSTQSCEQKPHLTRFNESSLFRRRPLAARKRSQSESNWA